MPERVAAQGTPADTAAILLDAARQLEARGKGEAAGAIFALILERYAGTPAAQEVETRLAAPGQRRLDRSGRVELMVWSTLYGLWLGVAVPAAFSADDATPYGLGLLVGGPTGFLVSKGYSENRPVSEGQARAITFGGTWGTWQGFGWREVLELGTKKHRYCTTPDPSSPHQSCYEDEEVSARAVFAAMVLGGLAGVGSGTALAGGREIPAGTATTVSLGALWGTWYGVAAGVLADLEDQEDGLLAAALVGGDAGLLATALLAPQWQLSKGRARLISIAGVAGGLAGAGLDLIIQPDDEKVAVLIPTLTSAAGLALGAAWTRDYDARKRSRFEGEGGEALLEVRDGRIAWDLPVPAPALLPADERGRRWEPGVRLELLRARF